MVFSKLKKVFKKANDCNNLGRADWCMENSSDCVWCPNNIQKGPLSEGKCIKKKNLRDRKGKPSQCPDLDNHVPTEPQWLEWKQRGLDHARLFGSLKKKRKSKKDKKTKKAKKPKKPKKPKKGRKSSHKSNKRRRTIRRRR